jgi:hypothetical protein
VAYGSRHWELFYQLQSILGEHGGCDALIYVSDAAQPINPPTVTWRATYLGFKKAKGGAHPAGMIYRPPTTQKYSSDNQGHWAVFWEVAELRSLTKNEWIKIGQLCGFEKPSKYLKNFIPRGPVLIQEPLVLSGGAGLSVLPS